MGTARTLRAPQHFAMPDLSGIDGMRPVPAGTTELDTVHLDTAALDLAHAGVTLRRRTGDDGPPWILTLPAARADGPVPARHEIRVDDEGDDVPRGVRDLVRAYTRSAPLVPVARLRTRRTVTRLVGHDGATLAELVDDDVTTVEGDRATGGFRELALQLHAGPRRTAHARRALTERLVEAGCRERPPVPRLVRALGPGALPEPDGFDGRTPHGPDELVRRTLTGAVRALQRFDTGVRLDLDDEQVHGLRVAARTLRSDLQTFAARLDPAKVAALRTELGALLEVLGRERDLTVLGTRLQQDLRGLPPLDQAGAAVLVARWRDRAAAARVDTLAALRSERYDALLDGLLEIAHDPGHRAATGPADRPAGGTRDARRLVRRAARRQYRRLARRATAALDAGHPGDETLHRVRIAAKRVRYADHAAEPVIGLAARAHADAVGRLQTRLGDLHDAVTAERWLREAALAEPACALVAGQLVAVQRRRAERLRRSWARAWHDADRRRLRRWLD